MTTDTYRDEYTVRARIALRIADLRKALRREYNPTRAKALRFQIARLTLHGIKVGQ